MQDLILIKSDVREVDWHQYPQPQAIITSPPYWAKRCYPIESTWWGGAHDCVHKEGDDGFCVKCGAWFGQLGAEPVPELFVDHLVSIFKRLPLRDDGVMWVNIDDTWIGGGGKYLSDDKREKWLAGTKQSNKIFIDKTNNAKHLPGLDVERLKSKGHKKKDLALVPEMFVIAMKWAGFYIRSKVIWHKSNGLPSSVLDRPQHFYENVYMISKSAKYYYNKSSVMVPVKETSLKRYARGISRSDSSYSQNVQKQGIAKPRAIFDDNPSKQRGIRDVWKCATGSGRRTKHIAVMPEGVVERAIKLTTRPGDWVLDPFVGSGTVMDIAQRLGRRCIGVDVEDFTGDLTKKLL